MIKDRKLITLALLGESELSNKVNTLLRSWDRCIIINPETSSSLPDLLINTSQNIPSEPIHLSDKYPKGSFHVYFIQDMSSFPRFECGRFILPFTNESSDQTLFRSLLIIAAYICFLREETDDLFFYSPKGGILEKASISPFLNYADAIAFAWNDIFDYFECVYQNCSYLVADPDPGENIPLISRVHPDDRVGFICDLIALVTGLSPKITKYLIQDYNESKRYLSLSGGISAEGLLQSVPCGLIIFEISISPKDQILTEVQRISGLIGWKYNPINGLFYGTDDFFNLLKLEGAEHILPLSTLSSLLEDDDKNKLGSFFDQCLYNENEQKIELRITYPNQSFRYLKVQGKKGRVLDTGICIIGTFQDITERHMAHEYMVKYIGELEEKNNELEKLKSQLLEVNTFLDYEVKKRTADIEEILKQKDEFITQIGHDLKTPLTPLIGILPVVRRKVSDPIISSYLDISIRNARHMQEILTSIIKMARMNEKYLPATGTDIAISEMIDELVINFQFAIMKKHMHIENRIDHSLKLRINPVDFDTIFENLLDNAIKYTPSGGNVIFSASLSDDGLKIMVQDNGIGLVPEDQIRIFDKFYKADSSRTDGKSYGLGLSIIRKIIERNGWSIKAESEGKEKGTKFFLTFPLFSQEEDQAS